MAEERAVNGHSPRGRKARRSQPVPVAEALDNLLESLGLKERIRERRLLSAWPEVVGEKIARFTRAVDIQAGVLSLQADHAAWRQEVTLLMPKIRDRYNARFGDGSVTEIKWDRRLPRRHPGDDQR